MGTAERVAREDPLPLQSVQRPFTSTLLYVGELAEELWNDFRPKDQTRVIEQNAESFGPGPSFINLCLSRLHCLIGFRSLVCMAVYLCAWMVACFALDCSLTRSTASPGQAIFSCVFYLASVPLYQGLLMVG